MTEATHNPPLARVIDSFEETRTSARIVAICGLTLCSILEIAALVLLAFALKREVPEVALRAYVMASVALIGAVPALTLFRYMKGMKAAVARRTVDSVEAALERHKNFWIVTALVILFSTLR